MGSVLEPDLAQAQRFLQALDPAGIFTFQTFDDNKERAASAKKGTGRDPLARVFHGTLERHLDALAAMQRRGAGAFVMVNRADGHGRSASNVTGIRAHFVDLDGAPVDPVLHAAAPPHIVVESSPGKWHAYWSVQDAQKSAFKGTQHALADKFGGDRAVCDLSRVMRVPGFWHLKATPFQSRLITPTAN